MAHYSIIISSENFEKELIELKRKDTVTFCKQTSDETDLILAWDEKQMSGWRLDQEAQAMEPIIPDEFGHTSHGVILSNKHNTAARFKMVKKKAKDLIVHLHLEDDRGRTCRGRTQLRVPFKKG